MSDLEQRVERLESIQAIREITARYAIHLDARELQALADLFVDDVKTGPDTERGQRAPEGPLRATVPRLGIHRAPGVPTGDRLRIARPCDGSRVLPRRTRDRRPLRRRHAAVPRSVRATRRTLVLPVAPDSDVVRDRDPRSAGRCPTGPVAGSTRRRGPAGSVRVLSRVLRPTASGLKRFRGRGTPRSRCRFPAACPRRRPARSSRSTNTSSSTDRTAVTSPPASSVRPRRSGFFNRMSTVTMRPSSASHSRSIACRYACENGAEMKALAKPSSTADLVVHVVAGEVGVDRVEAVPVVEGALASPERNAQTRFDGVDVDGHRYLTNTVSSRLIHSSCWLT